ncbi:MAG: tetratricopeptide repeat protein [Aureispira sp.]
MNKEELEDSIHFALIQGKKEQLETLSREAVSLYPREAFGYAYLAEAILMEFPTPYTKAEHCLAKATQLAPTNTSYIARFATVKDKQNQGDNAQVLWERLLEMDPNHLEALIAKGVHALNNVLDYHQAKVFFDRAIQHHMDDPQSYFYRAICYLKWKEFEKALKDYEYFVQLSGTKERVEELLIKVEICRGLNNIDRLTEAYNAISNLVPEDPFYYRECANVLFSNERYKAAAEQYRAALKWTHKTNAAYNATAFSLGDALYKDQQYEEAITVFDLYIENVESPIIGLLKQIDVFIQLKEYDNALNRIKVAQNINKDPLYVDQLVKTKEKLLIELKNMRFPSRR